MPEIAFQVRDSWESGLILKENSQQVPRGSKAQDAGHQKSLSWICLGPEYLLQTGVLTDSKTELSAPLLTLSWPCLGSFPIPLAWLFLSYASHPADLCNKLDYTGDVGEVCSPTGGSQATFW